MKRHTIVDVPLSGLDLTNLPQPGALPRRRQSRGVPGPRTIRRVRCPGGAHQGGLIVGTGHHLIWRPHNITTANGSTWLCPVVGACLCEAPAPPVGGVHTPTCDAPTPDGQWTW